MTDWGEADDGEVDGEQGGRSQGVKGGAKDDGGLEIGELDNRYGVHYAKQPSVWILNV